MTRSLHPSILRCGLALILAVPLHPAAAKDREKDKDDRRGNIRSQITQPPQNNLPKFGGNLPGAGSSNNNRINNPPVNHQPLGGGQPVLKRRDNDNKPAGGVMNNPNIGGGGNPIINRRDNNKPNAGMNNNPVLGGGQPVLKRRDNENKPAGGGGVINHPNNGVINNPIIGGGQPVLKRRDNDNLPGNTTNNPIIGGGNPVLKRRENDNKPGTGGINNNPVLGGGQPILKRRDDDKKPGGVINNPPIGGNNPIGGNLIPGNNSPRVNTKNPELKNHLKQFQPNVTKRQDNERNLIRNKDHVDQLLNGNPGLRNKVQTQDGKLDLSRLHLEHHGSKDRISSNIHKNGNLPIQLDNNQDLQQHFRQMSKAKNIQDLDGHFKHLQDPSVLQQHPEFARLNIQQASGHFQNNIVNIQQNTVYNTLLVSNVGKQLNLQQQYNLYQHGDVARQLNLNVALVNGGGWQNRYLGPVYGNYTKACFSSWYCGPGFYPNYAWTPTWSPWVDWCWWNTCLPIYDPRPLYCRPVVYDPCPVWTVYTYPVWQPLPVVASGTWIDYSPVLVENVDLQLVAVRFVDNGHPEQQLGARYRVWLKNSSRVGIAGNFNVLLMASNTPDASADLPQAGVTIPSMDPGEMQVVDVRLPFASSRMNRVDNHLTPFNYLHVLVDSHRQLDDVNIANNGAVIPRAEILPVDPAAFAPDVSAAAPGAIISLAGEGFGPEPGRLIVSVNGVQTEATIYGWYDLGVQFELPNVAVNAPTDAEVLVVRGDGAASNPVTVRLAPENRLQEAALPPAPLP